MNKIKNGYTLFGQVNAEIKRLLVASVGEDIGDRYFEICCSCLVYSNGE